jgi:hypothetical protein
VTLGFLLTRFPELKELKRGEIAERLVRTHGVVDVFPAVELYRKLAAAQPDAFLPGLARSLNVMADHLESLSRLADAVQSDEEALRALGPMFLSTPAPFSTSMAVIVYDYIRRLQVLNRQPRPDVVDLLVRIVAVLSSQKQPDPPAHE